MIVKEDNNLNGDEYQDVFAIFEYPEAVEMNDTREKLYLKVLQNLCDSLDPEDP